MGFFGRLIGDVKHALNDRSSLDTSSLEPRGLLGRKRTAKDYAQISEQEKEIDRRQRRIDAETMLQILEAWNEIREEYESTLSRDCIDETRHLYWNSEVSSRTWNYDWQSLVGLIKSFASNHLEEIQELTQKYPKILARIPNNYKPYFTNINKNVFEMISTIEREIIPMRNNQALRSGEQPSDITEQKSNVTTILKNEMTDTSLALSSFWVFIKND